MWLLIAFIAVPLIEIALFIQIGGAIGLLSTLAVVVVTAVLGTFLVKQQGIATLNQLRGQLSGLQDPTETLAHGAMILFSGALLLTPGFFTDAVGFALLIPGVRKSAFEAVRARVKVQNFSMNAGPQRPTDNSVIDGEYEEIQPEPEPRRRSGPSGWTNSEHKD